MAPPADQDSLLLFLQGKVATLRREHSGLVEREAVLRKAKMFASADALLERVQRTSKELKAAEARLNSHAKKRTGHVQTSKPEADQ